MKKISSMGCNIVLLALALCMLHTCECKLSENYYQKTCPGAYKAVRDVVKYHISTAPTLAAPLLRLHFHDCFVRGCDGSVLLNSTSAFQAEKDAPPNLSLRGYHVIDAAKAAVEKICPGIVSCADLVALVARDSVQMIGGPFWQVPTGRRDGVFSARSEALVNLPPPTANLSRLLTMFGNKGLDTKDLVSLSGGHTIGTSHCTAFTNRLYNFTGVGDADPSLQSMYANKLKMKCIATDTTSLVEMDPGSFKIFDTKYFEGVSKRRGLFQSDSALLTSAETKALVESVQNDAEVFFKAFAESMVKMGKVGVLTGSQGEIRHRCTLVNSS